MTTEELIKEFRHCIANNWVHVEDGRPRILLDVAACLERVHKEVEKLNDELDQINEPFDKFNAELEIEQLQSNLKCQTGISEMHLALAEGHKEKLDRVQEYLQEASKNEDIVKGTVNGAYIHSALGIIKGINK